MVADVSTGVDADSALHRYCYGEIMRVTKGAVRGHDDAVQSNGLPNSSFANTLQESVEVVLFDHACVNSPASVRLRTA